jgi:hypothetical protein
VLASIGAVGLVTSGASVVGAVRGEPPYTHYTYAQTDDGLPNLQIAWYETYNGTFQERSSSGLEPNNESFEDAASAGEFVDDDAAGYVDAGPVISFDNVMPDDEGHLAIGLLTTNQPGQVWFRPYAPATLDGNPNYLENDHIEPERTAGDTTDTVGELQDELRIEVWYDSGMMGLGACNGRFEESVEQLVGDGTGVVSGTLREMSEQFPEGIQLFDGCTEVGESRCVGVRWWLPGDTGNHVQTDSVGFELQFAATECLDEPMSPFVEAST